MHWQQALRIISITQEIVVAKTHLFISFLILWATQTNFPSPSFDWNGETKLSEPDIIKLQHIKLKRVGRH